MSDRSKALLGGHPFNGLSAVGGGLALMVGWIPEQPSGRSPCHDEAPRRLATLKHRRRNRHGLLDSRRGCLDPGLPLPAGDLF